MATRFPVPSPSQFLALSCTNVGCGPGGSTSMLARVVLVDYRGQTVFDSYVVPTNDITDFRTSTTGLLPEHLATAVPFNIVQQHVAAKISGKVLVGHSIWNDLSVLGIPHPAVATRDVALYIPFRNALKSASQIVGLQTLMYHLMARRIQEHQQNPRTELMFVGHQLENSRAAVDLYRSHATEWEASISVGNWPSALPPSTFSRCYL